MVARRGAARSRHAPILARARRPLGEFLTLPALIVAGFLALAVLVDRADNAAGSPETWGPVRAFLGQYAGDTQSAIGLLSAVAGSLFTVASVTFSILLLAVQQGAASLTSQVVDQYLRRTSNKAYFGFFTGTSIFVLVTLVQTTHTPHPVFGVVASTACASASLLALLLLIYSTIDQMRPASLVRVVRDATLEARARQAPWLERTSAPAPGDEGAGAPVLSARDGYLARLNVDALGAVAARDPRIRIAVIPSMGDHVTAGHVLARVAGVPLDDALRADLARALPVEADRDVRSDAAWGVDHLGNVGWTAACSVKSDPAIAALACDALSEILARWTREAPARAASARVAYPDRVVAQVIDQFEDFVVASVESQQHQSLAMVAEILARRLPGLGAAERGAVARVADTMAAALPSHLPTRALRAGVTAFADALAAQGHVVEARRLWSAVSLPGNETANTLGDYHEK